MVHWPLSFRLLEYRVGEDESRAVTWFVVLFMRINSHVFLCLASSYGFLLVPTTKQLKACRLLLPFLSPAPWMEIFLAGLPGIIVCLGYDISDR